jgi:hypothetical protein
LTVAIIMCFTENSTLLCAGSIFQVVVPAAAGVWVAVVILVLLNRRVY